MRRCATLAAVILAVGCHPDDGDSETATPFQTRTSAITIDVPGDFDTLDDAAAAAGAGDEIVLGEGVHEARVILGTAVHLRGAGIGRTEIRGLVGVGRGVDATFSDLSFVGEGRGWAVGGFASGAITVERCEIRGYEEGVSIGAPQRPLVVRDSRIVGNVHGIVVSSAEGLLANNEILNNTRSGIRVVGASALQIVHNTLVGNAFNAGDDDTVGALAFEVTNGSLGRNNIIVGNHIGLNCLDCGDVLDHNAVWGNIQDYVGSAAAHATDVRVDPRFVDPARWGAASP